MADRYTTLQRKVDHLERVHHDGKKAHQAEVERLKAELARCQKLGDKQKKQIDLLESRLQDLKKSNASDQSEIKDLRVKLRMSDHEKTLRASETKKSLHTLETKRDRRIAELEKTLAEAARKLQDAAAEAEQAQGALAAKSVQLEDYRNLVGQVAQEYGRLAHDTVSRASYTRLRQENTTLTIQVARLERKLANSVAQVDELAVLIRQTNDQKTFLAEQLEQVDREIAFYQDALLDRTQLVRPDESPSDILVSVEREHAGSLQDVHALDTALTSLFSQFYQTTSEQLLREYAFVQGQLKCEQKLSEQHSVSLSSALASHKATAAQLERVEGEKDKVDVELKAAKDLVDSLRVSEESLTRRAEGAEEKLAHAATHEEAAVKKERDVTRRLTEAMQKMRTAEDTLRAEIEQLTGELTDAERYQEAYHTLSNEVGSLVARNQLAEEEAQKLSKFNAEILGHNNPAQRIMYVDRIRRELAETKHKLVMLEREQDAAVALNDDLQHELDMYKSIMVPADSKPRTVLTRVTRPPLVSLNASAVANNDDESLARREHGLESIHD